MEIRPVKVEKSQSDISCLSIYLAGLLSEVYIYMIVRHPHIYTYISGGAELVKDGY